MKKNNKSKKHEERVIKNPVAKFAFHFNRSKVFNDKTKYQRNNKHKGKESFPIVSLDPIGKDFFLSA